LSSDFENGSRDLSQPAEPRSDAVKSATCRVRLADIRDLRVDQQTMGRAGARQVIATDPVGWLRSGLETLGRDRQIQIADGPDGGDADLSIGVDLLNAYIMNITSETTATNVVVRVHFSRKDLPTQDKVYRGTSNGLNWTGGSSETQAAFDDALSDLLKGLDSDIRKSC
jgi:hypothetical protein